MHGYSRSGRHPDRGLIAAYLEGILDAPAAHAVSALVETDAAWAAELALQKRVSSVLAAAPSPDGSAASARVWDRLTVSLAAPPPFWRRRIAVPAPLAFAAAALVLVLSFGLVYTTARGSVPTVRITTVPNGLKQVQIHAPIADLRQLLRTIEMDAPSREVVISLPESSQMYVVGEPVLLRANELDRSGYR